jgi:uncharacterized membrane protein YkoI
MDRRLTLAIAAIVLVAAGPVAAAADVDAKQLKLVRASSTGLRQAVLTAERDLKGRAYAAKANIGDVIVTFTVKVLTGDKPMSVLIDGKTGKITETSSVAGENAGLLHDFSKLKGSLLAAMKAAETTAKGKTFDAKYGRIANQSVFQVNIAGRDDVEKDVIIDAVSGKIRKVTERSAEISGTASMADPAQPASAQ